MEYALNVLYRKLKTNLTEVCVVYENKKKIKTFQKVIKISFLLLVENFFCTENIEVLCLLGKFGS